MVQISHREQIHTSYEKLWKLLLEKVEHPDRTIKEVETVKILERYDDGVLREMTALGSTIRERITINKGSNEIRFDLVDNPLFEGYFINKINGSDGKLVLIYLQNWEPKNDKAKAIESSFLEILTNAVKEMKILAES